MTMAYNPRCVSRLVFAGPRLLDTKRESDPIGPTETVLRGVFASTCSPTCGDHIVLLHHSPSCVVGPIDEPEPAACRLIGQVAPAIAAYPFDREPLERRPAVGAVPLLARREVRRDEAAGLQKVALEARGDASALIVSRNAEVERRGRCERRPIGDERAPPGAPAPIEEESRLGVVHRENRSLAGVGALREPAEERVIAPAIADKRPGRDRALGIIEKAVEIDRNQIDRLERAEVFGVPHPAAREVPAALRGRPGVAIESGAKRLG